MQHTCFFARAADNEPICGLHREQLSLKSEHGNLDPQDGLLSGKCPVSGIVVREQSNDSDHRAA